MSKQYAQNHDDYLIVEVLDAMQPKIKKSLQNTSFQEQEDLTQDIYLKIVRAIKTKRIKPITLEEFKANFDKKCLAEKNG